MFTRARRRRAIRRIQPGDGRPLRRFRWWQLITGRSLFSLAPEPAAGRLGTYTVDVRHLGDAKHGEPAADLYLDGRRHASALLPAVFPVEGGEIEVAMGGFGVRRCHFATGGGDYPLTPDPRSGEGRRARFDRSHPAASRLIGAASWVLLAIGVVANLLEAAVPLSQIPPVAERFGTFTPPFDLPLWLTIALGAGAALGGAERALRLRYHWLLDGAGA
ncbi:hypothetical protein [Nocardiopsis coralliicola]